VLSEEDTLLIAGRGGGQGRLVEQMLCRVQVSRQL
jgi:hypothetical protein